MTETPNQAVQKKGKGRALILIGFLLFIIFMIWTGSYFSDDLEALVFTYARDVAAWVASNVLLYSLIFFLLYALVTAFGLPLSVLLSLGGAAVLALALGFWPAVFLSTLLVWLGVVGGSWGLFEFVSRYGASAFDSLIGPYLDQFRQGFGRDQFFYMLASRFTPLPPAVMTVVPAVLHARRGAFLAAAGIGFLPGVFVYAAMGAKLGDLIGQSQEGLSFAAVVTLGNTWPLLALLILSLLPLIIRLSQRYFSSNTNKGDTP